MTAVLAGTPDPPLSKILWFSLDVLGIIIGKISRPSRQRKSILWSSQAVINNVEKYWEGGEDDGHYTDDGKVNSLVFRLANMRNGQIYAPKFTLLLMRRESPSDNDEGVLNGDGGK